METIWFALVALMIAMYVVLDGFDIGAGIVHLWIARTDAERRKVIGSIGPVWDANEVWLIAGGGTLYFAFPALYSSSFAGFYLPLMMVLWLLILRGTSVAFRSDIVSPIWADFWDVVFAISSVLLAVFFGAALGNVIRGVPLDSKGIFFEPLWTNFLPGANPGILDWYTILVGLAALAALTMHGALWVALKTSEDVSARASRLAKQVWWAVALLTIAITISSFKLQPQLAFGLRARPWGFVFPVLAVAGLLGVLWFERERDELKAFLASCAYIIGMLTSAATALYPYVLPAATNPSYGLTVYSAHGPEHGLRVGLVWWIIGMALATGYAVFTYRRFAGKVDVSSDAEGESY
ncbi:MAG: cytochrome d ubiquinol oxidase subunit II [Candidatus Acidiferrales bacterium]